MADELDAAQVLAALGLTIHSTDHEIDAAARYLDLEAPEHAIEAIRVTIEAVRAAGQSGPTS